MGAKLPLSGFRELTGQLTGQLKELLPELGTYARHPRRVGVWLEQHSTWLSRRVLSAASNFSDPYLAGMGLQIVELGETRAELTMPSRWRTQAEGGVVHVGALATLAEFATRVFWERHLNLVRYQIHVTRLEARYLAQTASDTRAVFEFAEAEREASLFRLRAEGQTQVACPVAVYDDQGRMIAEIVVEWHLTSPKALGAGREPGTAGRS